MEIVTDPCITSAEAARRYAEELRLLLLTIGASDAAMEEGQMRVEANVSLRPVGTDRAGTRVEVKNMNSFRSVERAIAFEVERQTAALECRRAARPGDARLGRHPRRDVHDAAQGRVSRTIATSRSRTCRHCAPTPHGSRRFARRCPSCPPHAASATCRLRAVGLRRGGDRNERRLVFRRGHGRRAERAPTPSASRACFSKIGLRELKTSPDLLDSRDPAQLARVAALVGGGDISSRTPEQVYERAPAERRGR